MCVVNQQFQLLEFVFDSAHVDLQYDEIYLISIAGCVLFVLCLLWCDHSTTAKMTILGLCVRLS